MSAAQVGDPTRSPDDRAASVVRAWVAFYTKGLSAEQAAERQSLIDADLWDEAIAADWMGESSGLPGQRLGRLVRGVPSDITWRLEQGRQTEKKSRRTEMRTSKLQLAVIGVLTVFYGGFLLVGLLTQRDFRESDVMIPATVGLGLCVAGLLLSIPRPTAGFVVGMIGIGIAFMSMWWLFPFYIPLPIVLGYRLIRWQDAQHAAAAPGA